MAEAGVKMYAATREVRYNRIANAFVIEEIGDADAG